MTSSMNPTNSNGHNDQKHADAQIIDIPARRVQDRVVSIIAIIAITAIICVYMYAYIYIYIYTHTYIIAIIVL